MKKYITIGTKDISKDAFRQVLRPPYKSLYKPNGGLWSSEFISKINCISQWHDYLLYDDPETAAYKDLNIGALFTLNDNAKILILDSTEKIINTSKEYPSYHYILSNNDIQNKLHIIDYESLSKDYDGVYVSVNQLGFNKISYTFTSWSVDTLLLFNLDCIKEYQSVDIFTPTNPYGMPPHITNISTPKQVLPYSEHYKEVYNYVREIFENLMLEIDSPFYNYMDYYNKVIETIEKTIIIVAKIQERKINSINERLKTNNINIQNKALIKTIAYNYLSSYLKENRYKEESFIKTLKK